MKRILIFTLLLVLLVSTAAAAVDYPVDSPYETYVYNSSNNPIAIPSTYQVDRIIYGTDISDVNFRDLDDIFYDGHDRLYICDAGNNRILVTDKGFSVVKILETFDNNGVADAFNAPTGIFANGENIYVADSKNGRIVMFKRDTFELVRVFEKPDVSLLGESFNYVPARLAVDKAGRIYVIAEGINQGLLCLDEEGEFTSFLGAPQVVPNFIDIIWRKIATEAQRKQMESYVPTEYDSVQIDKYGFLYVTSQTSEKIPVGKINSNGKNVLIKLRENAEYGDKAYLKKLGEATYMPRFADVALADNDVYYTLDSQTGRIFGYSEDGYMLYAFGITGSQKGTFRSPSAIEYMDGKLLVADRSKGNITVLSKTAFGAKVHKALELYNSGKYDEAESLWKEVGLDASGYTLSIIGLAKIDMQKGLYRQAMKRLKPIREHYLYTLAFSNWRDNFIRDNFIWLLLAGAAIIVVFILVRKYVFNLQSIKKVKESWIYKGFKYGNYVMFHPFDGFWDLKWEKKGNTGSATLIVVLFFFLYGLRAQFSGYVVTKTVSEEVNALYNITLMFLPLLFYVIANWCFTTLMDGKGTLTDIYIATAYALKPYVLFSIPLFILSHVLTDQEASFYQFADVVCLIWILALLFVGLMVTHDYSLPKTVLSVILILIGICLIIFILLLLVHIVQDVYQFVYNSYRELSFRFY